MPETDRIIIRGLKQNNLKNISLDVPKGKIVVFTGVSGSGKSSIVFDTIAAESQRQMNETYTAFMRGRLPKFEKPKVERIDHLSASVIVDQSRLGGNARSTVGTISDLPAFRAGNYYWRMYVGSGLFDPDKKYKDYTPEEQNLLLYGSRTPDGPREHRKIEGIKNQFQRLCLMKGPEEQRDST